MLTGHIINYIKLTLLHSLGYIDINNRALLVPGAVMLDIGHQMFSHEFEQELILMFELLRHNLFKPSIILIENKMLIEQVHIINDNFIKILVNKYLDRSEGEFSVQNRTLSDATQDSSPLFSSGKENSEEYYDDPEILSREERNLAAFQRVIKGFQLEFTKFVHLGYPISDFEMVVNMAFRASRISKIILLSRFFPFAVSDFHTNTFYGQDSYQFRELSNVMNACINNLNALNLLAFMKEENQLENFEFLKRMRSEMPFRKNYSADACMLIKIMLGNFLIYKALRKIRHPLTAHYRDHISIGTYTSRFEANGDIVQLIARGRALFKRFFVITKSLRKFAPNDHDEHIFVQMNDCYPLFKQFCEFYNVPSDSQIN